MRSRKTGAVGVIGLILLTTLYSANAEKPSLAESILHLLLVDAAKNVQNEPKDQTDIYKEYDFIIVGAGSAGCVVANRLSEVRKWKILLIEAGGEENFLMDIPILANFWQFSDANWKYKTQPSPNFCLGMENAQCHWPRGKVMGGSSVLNYMIYTRGNKRDYDIWEELGNEGWKWNDVLPYFKKSENSKPTEITRSTKRKREVYSTTGHMSVTEIPFRTPIADAFVESGRQMGYPMIDFNGTDLFGFNYLQVSMKNGTRWSSSRAYLHPVNIRSNLHVKKRSMVTKIIIDPETKIAKGLEFIHNRRKYVVYATKEVILSAGAVNSPHLLMLSGVGPKDHLASKNITVIQNSKVGYNMQDHYLPGGLTYTIEKPYSMMTQRIVNNTNTLVDYLSYHRGPLSVPGGCEALAFFELGNQTDGTPNMELLLISGSIQSEDTLYKNFNMKSSIYKDIYEPLKNIDTVMIFPILLSSKSRGRILLRDNNPFHHPLIHPNYFSDKEGYDMRIIIAGIRKSNEVLSMRPFRDLGARPLKTVLPQCKNHVFDSDEYWECYARHLTFTIYHPVGTCKMGPDSDPDAVVDNRLRVRGIQNLRVIDASIMPIIPSSHTNAPVYMIAEKASDMIKEDWNFNVARIHKPKRSRRIG